MHKSSVNDEVFYDMGTGDVYGATVREGIKHQVSSTRAIVYSTGLWKETSPITDLMAGLPVIPMMHLATELDSTTTLNTHRPSEYRRQYYRMW